MINDKNSIIFSKNNKEISKSRSWLYTSVAALAVLGMPSAANALQDAEFEGLEEIVVTASKREQTLQDAGVSVTVLSDLALERMGADGFSDFAVRVPNLGFGAESDGRFNSNSPAIRGIFGSGTTGFYIDEMPIPAGMQPRVIDVSRIEVLRGPQGSLYGARSMGGTIRMITKQPDMEGSSGRVHAKLSSVKGGDANWNVDGSFNIPLVEDKVAVRMTAYYGQNSGIYDKEYIPNWTEGGAGDGVTVHDNPGPKFETQENVDDETYRGFQIVGLAKLSDNLTFTPKFMYQKISADGLPFADVTPDNDVQARYYDVDESGFDRWWLASGTLNWDLGSGTLVSSTSYFDRYLDETEEMTGFLFWLFNNAIVPIDPLYSDISQSEDFTSLVHETRYTSSLDGPLQYTLGVFYQKNENTTDYPASYMNGMNAALGFEISPDDLIYIAGGPFNTKEIAAFGEVTYEFNDWLSLTGGGRWYKTTTESTGSGDGFANGGPSSFDGEQSETGFNPKVLLQADVSDNVNVYATASKGYRVGGVNGNLSDALCGDELNALGITSSDAKTYDSDSLWSYEAGVKSKLADNRVSLNASAFFVEWSNIQQLNRLGCGFQYVGNAGKAETKGFEAELLAAPIEGLTLSLAVGYTAAKITDAAGAVGVTVGDKIQGVPDWTISSGGEYVFPLTDDLEGLLRADFNYYGRSYSSNNETSAASQRLRPSWVGLNLRAGVMLETWEVALFVNNVTNERANLADSRSLAAEEPGRQRLVTNRPRTIGLEFRARF